MSQRFENGYFALVLTCAVCLFAIGLVSWTIPYSSGYERADQDHQAAYATNQTAEENERKCRSELTIEKALRCYRDAYNADREQERAEQDLDAQREMANWAEGMLWATVLVGCVTSGVTALGVFYVARTLTATSETLSAAREANVIMRGEQRPWIKVKISKDVKLVREGRDSFVRYRIEAENIGKTSAYEVSLQSKLVLFEGVSGLGDAHEIAMKIWNVSETTTEYSRNRRGSAKLPGGKTFQICDDSLSNFTHQQLVNSGLAITIKVEYFTPFRRAKFQKSGAMFKLLNPQDKRFSCELFQLVDGVEGEALAWSHLGEYSYLT